MVAKRDIYGPIIRVIIPLVVLALINVILNNIPMVRDLSVPGLPINASGIISAIIGIIMIGILLNFKRSFSPKIKELFPQFTESGKIVDSAILLIIIIVMYLMFRGLIVPFMGGMVWLYAVIFLLIALYPTYRLVRTLYKGSYQVSDIVTDKIAEDTGELVKCPKCGERVPGSAKFCPNCRAKLGVPETTTIKCPKCGAENKSTSKFCLNCAAPLVKKDEEEVFEV